MSLTIYSEVQEIKSSVFGRLKARWRVLTKTVDLRFEIVPAVVYSCFVFHNFFESKNYSGLDEEEVGAQIMRH